MGPAMNFGKKGAKIGPKMTPKWGSPLKPWRKGPVDGFTDTRKFPPMLMNKSVHGPGLAHPYFGVFRRTLTLGYLVPKIGPKMTPKWGCVKKTQSKGALDRDHE